VRIEIAEREREVYNSRARGELKENESISIYTSSSNSSSTKGNLSRCPATNESRTNEAKQRERIERQGHLRLDLNGFVDAVQSCRRRRLKAAGLHSRGLGRAGHVILSFQQARCFFPVATKLKVTHTHTHKRISARTHESGKASS